MDKDFVQSIGTLFVKNSETYDYSESQSFFRAKEWEYEKRSISSLLLGSGGGISFILAYITATDLSNSASIAAFASIVSFLFALLLAGISQFILNEAASLNFRHYTTRANHQNYVSSLERYENLEKLNKIALLVFKNFSSDDEKTSDNKFSLIDKMNTAKIDYLEFERKALRCELIASRFILGSCGTFFFGVLIAIAFILSEHL